MPQLQDIKNGNFKVSARTSISHNGQIYRGVKEINDLVARVLPDESEAKSEPAAKASRKLSKSEQRRHDAQRDAASPAPQAGRTAPSDATTPPSQPADS